MPEHRGRDVEPARKVPGDSKLRRCRKRHVGGHLLPDIDEGTSRRDSEQLGEVRSCWRPKARGEGVGVRQYPAVFEEGGAVLRCKQVCKRAHIAYARAAPGASASSAVPSTSW